MNTDRLKHNVFKFLLSLKIILHTLLPKSYIQLLTFLEPCFLIIYSILFFLEFDSSVGLYLSVLILQTLTVKLCIAIGAWPHVCGVCLNSH